MCILGDSDSDEWPMEQEDKGLKMEPLLCDPSPVLLPNLTLTLTPKGPASEPVTDASLTPPAAQVRPLSQST